MADIEPLFPNMPAPRVSDHQLAVAREQELALRRRDEVDDWMERTLEQERRGRTTAWIIACILIIVCFAQAAAIAVMLPLKEVVPYTVLVDKQTGYVETARGIRLGDLAEDEAIVQSMLAQYILARETFDPADFADRYDRVALWSLGTARDDYVAQYQAGAPDSVLGGIRPGTVLKIVVKKIDLLSNDTARVRFEAERRDTGAAPVRSDWQSTVSFRFTGAPMRMEDRLLNPLGFQVTGYRRDPEVAGQPSPTAVPTDSSLAQTPPTGVDTPGTGLAPDKGAKQ
jgi:type IV secretion system protein VirB8